MVRFGKAMAIICLVLLIAMSGAAVAGFLRSRGPSFVAVAAPQQITMVAAPANEATPQTFSKPAEGCSDCGQGEVAGTKGPCTGAVCPVYIYMMHGDYCSWYALKCSETGPPAPCNFDGVCNSSGAAHDMCSASCTGCTITSFEIKPPVAPSPAAQTKGSPTPAAQLKAAPAAAAVAPTAATHKDLPASPGVKGGNPNKKHKKVAADVTPNLKAGAKITHAEGKLLWFEVKDDAGNLLSEPVVQVWEVDVVSGVTLCVGQEVDEPKPVDKATVISSDDHVFVISGGNEYQVVLHNMTKVHPDP